MEVVFQLTLGCNRCKQWLLKFLAGAQLVLVFELGLHVGQDYANKLRNRLENENAITTVLVSCLQDPVVTTDEVAVRHNIFG